MKPWHHCIHVQTLAFRTSVSRVKAPSIRPKPDFNSPISTGVRKASFLSSSSSLCVHVSTRREVWRTGIVRLGLAIEVISKEE